MLSQLLREELVFLHLEAPNQEAALAELVAHIPNSVLSNRHKSSTLEAVVQRETFGTTAIGDQMAFPHCFLKFIQEPILCIGISRKGIHFPSLDGQPVHLILMMIFPEAYRVNGTRLAIMKEAGLIFRDRFLRERLKISESSAEAYEIFVREAAHLTALKENLKHTA